MHTKRKTSQELHHKTLTMTTELQVLKKLMSCLHQMGAEVAIKAYLLFSQAERASVTTLADLNLDGQSPVDFESTALTTQPQCQLTEHPVGFEPTSTNTFKLELNPLDLMTMQTRPHISSWHVRQILTQQ
jgi:hypothetical protein